MSTYRIRSGDTLSHLARRHGTTVQALARANGIANPDRIYAGRTLTIPDGFDGPSRQRPSASSRLGHAPGDGHVHADGATTTSPGGPGGLHAGRGWGGSEGVADAARAIARELGIPVTSLKRDAAQTRALDSNFRSDHYTGNTQAYAVDFGVAGPRGDQLARAIARRYGIPESHIGTYNRHVITVDGQRYSLQLLWRVEGHFNHVHLGIRRAD